MRITLNIIFITACISIIIACKDNKSNAAITGQKAPAVPPTFSAVIANAFPLNRTVEAPGTILPNETTDMKSEISGRVVAINFKEGTFVQKGTLLVKLFDADLRAQLNKLEVQLKVAEATAGRQTELLAINGASQQDYDNAVLNVSNIKADMELLKVQISQTELRAPFNGRLGLRNISLGAYVTPLDIITNISQVNVVKVEFAVPERYASEMVAGKLITLNAANNNKKYEARILAAQNVIAEESRNLMVRAVVQNTDNSLPPGAFVRVAISVGNNAAAIMVPTEAVIPSTRTRKLILVRDGKAVFQDVETGFRDSARVEVSGGIRAGDTVVTSGLLTIKEGMSLKVAIKK